MINLISLGGPHQGVHRYPRCEQKFGTLCNAIQSLANSLAYSWFFQKSLAPITYWHDTDEERYRSGSSYLAVINNERDYNANYVINLDKVRRIILVKYERDGAIVPNSSSWFGYHDAYGNEIPMEQTEIYQRDKLGLHALKQSGKLVQVASPGDHLDLDQRWFTQNIVAYLIET